MVNLINPAPDAAVPDVATAHQAALPGSLRRLKLTEELISRRYSVVHVQGMTIAIQHEGRWHAQYAPRFGKIRAFARIDF